MQHGHRVTVGRMSGSAIVVGAGVIGCATALALQRDGWAVRLLDPNPPGEACSAGNAGHLGTASVLPMATPQQIRALPRLLRQADGPLAVHWPYVLRNLPWFVRFVANGRRPRMEANARALAELLEPVPAAWATLAASAGAESLVERRGLLLGGRGRYLPGLCGQPVEQPREPAAVGHVQGQRGAGCVRPKLLAVVGVHVQVHHQRVGIEHLAKLGAAGPK